MAEPWLIRFFACNREMQPFSFFFSYSLLGGGGGGGISGRVRALNLTVPLGSGRVGSDDLGYGPGSGFSFEPVQTSSLTLILTLRAEWFMSSLCGLTIAANFNVKLTYNNDNNGLIQNKRDMRNS